MLSHEEIISLTKEYSGEWGIYHSERLLHMVSILGEGMEYNREAVWLAAYLHDWGGYEKWSIPGVDHFIRSREVAEEFLSEHGYPEGLSKLVLECIEFHHGGDPNRSIESILLTDADALDLLGVVGVCRVFAMNYRDLKSGWEWVKRWREKNLSVITLEKTKQMAAERAKETDELLKAFEAETFGLF